MLCFVLQFAQLKARLAAMAARAPKSPQLDKTLTANTDPLTSKSSHACNKTVSCQLTVNPASGQVQLVIVPHITAAHHPPKAESIKVRKQPWGVHLDGM